MVKPAAWHSVQQDVHRNNSNCLTGYRIRAVLRLHGEGARPLCAGCAALGNAYQLVPPDGAGSVLRRRAHPRRR